MTVIFYIYQDALRLWMYSFRDVSSIVTFSDVRGRRSTGTVIVRT